LNTWSVGLLLPTVKVSAVVSDLYEIPWHIGAPSYERKAIDEQQAF
jgi:hypothetical protein